MQSVMQGGQCPIPQDEIFEVARVSVDIAKMFKKLKLNEPKVISTAPN